LTNWKIANLIKKQVIPIFKKMVDKRKALIFDMDDVLIDVSNSTRVAIKKTVEFFVGRLIEEEEIEEMRLNEDSEGYYRCIEKLLEKRELYTPREIIKKKFQEYYINRNFSGLIKNERWMLDSKLLNSLSKKYKLGLRSNRGRIETEFALELAKAKKYFRSIVTSDDVSGDLDKELMELAKKMNAKGTCYVGNSVDDYEASKKAELDFIGIIPPKSDKLKYKQILKKRGAKVVLNHVNDIRQAVK